MKLFSFLSFLFIVLQVYANDDDKLIKIFCKNEKDAELVHKFSLAHSDSVDVWNHPIANRRVLAQFTKNTLQPFLELAKNNGIIVEVANHNITKLFEQNINEQRRKFFERSKLFLSINQNEFAENFNLDQYHSYNEIIEYLKSIEKKSSSTLGISLTSIGKTYEQRDIYILAISKQSQIKKKILMLECNVHAREWVSGAACLKMVDKFTVNQDNVAKKILNLYDIHILPVLNPDGFEYSRQHMRSWRKNRSVNKGVQCKGTDVNRNFDVAFGTVGVNATDPCSLIYCGSAPFSELESQTLRDYALSISKQLEVYISLHSFSQLLMYPWAYKPQLMTNDKEMRRLSYLAREAIKSVQGCEDYTAGPIYTTIYGASGSTLDWIEINTGGKYTFVFEMRDRGEYGFMLPEELIDPAFMDVWTGIEQLVLNIKQ